MLAAALYQIHQLSGGLQSLCIALMSPKGKKCILIDRLIDVQGTCACEAELAASSEGCREVHHFELAEGQARVSEGLLHSAPIMYMLVLVMAVLVLPPTASNLQYA